MDKYLGPSFGNGEQGKNLGPGPQFVGDEEQARRVAKKLFDLYDRDKNGVLDPFEIGPLMVDTYRGMSKNFFPGREDINGLQEIMDSDRDGKVNYADVEQFALRILAGQPNLTLPPVSQQSELNNTSKFGQISEILESIAKRIFDKFDYQSTGFIDISRVPDMIKETYRGINPNYEPSQQDINFWMNMLDLDRDGKITLREFKDCIQKSFQNANIFV